jgi:hypothetical protein
MAGDMPTLDAMWRTVGGGPITDALLEWPPDVFALTEVILEQSEAYRFVVSPPAGEHWPPPRFGDWSDAVVAAATAWIGWVGDGDGSPPEFVANAWAVVREAAGTSVERIAEGAEWRTCEALLTLHAVADEACAGMSVDVGGLGGPGSAVRGRARELLARTGSLARVARTSLRVLPKVRTPAGGISMRSLARYACVRGPGVDAVWHKVPTQRSGYDPRRRPANILLLPWPLRIRESDFRAQQASVQRPDREPFGFFEFAPAEPFNLDLVDRLLVAACDEVDAVDMVVLPESAVPDDVVGELESVLERHGVGTLMCGVRDRSTPAGQQPRNWVHIGVSLGGRWWHYRQNKHHRWSLDESQVLQYHLGGALHPGMRWWETMEVPRRSIQFVELGGGVTIVAVVCEDLARLDAVADLIRTVGPTLVLTVLLDGPQLASRWTARYASVLADDPGSAVLTLTALGMVERSLPAGFAPSRVVALWKDPTQGIREIPLDAGAQGVLLSTSVDHTTRHSADGRWPADNASHLRGVGVHQVRTSDRQATRPSPPAPPLVSDAHQLDECDLTVLASWAAAVAEAGSGEDLDDVLADGSPAAPWRARLGLARPSAALGAALGALEVAARQAGDDAPVDSPARLARHLLRAAIESRDRGVDAGRR